MNIVFVGDLHVADRPPAGRVDDYTFTALGKLELIARVCEEAHAKYVFLSGDIFHIKRPNQVSHELVQELIIAFKRFPCPVYVVPGNHDMGPDELESLTRQPLGVLERAGAIHLLLQAKGFGVKKGNPEFWVIPRPWNTKRDADPNYYNLTEQEFELITNSPAPVIGLAHGSIVNPGNHRPFPFVDVADIPDIAEYDLFFSGHLHENLGVHQVIPLTLFANPGSVMRVSRNQASYSRKVQVLKVEVTERDLKTELIDIPAAPAAQVFGAKESEPHRYELNDQVQQFIEQLGEGLRADELTIPELLAGLDLEPNVAQLVQHLLEEAAV